MPTNENAAPPTSLVSSVMTPAQGAMSSAAVALSLRHGERSHGRLVLCFQAGEFEARHGVELDQPALGVELDLALLDQRLGLHDLRLACLVRKDGDDVALLDAAAAAHPQVGEDAAGARKQRDLLVGFGAARQQQLAVMLHQLTVEHRDAERRRRGGGRRLDGGAAFRRFMRQEMAGRDPQRGACDQADGGEMSCSHFVAPALARSGVRSM